MDHPSESRALKAAPEGRVPPYSIEAETAVLGGVLLNNDALFLIQHIVKPDDFYVEAHRKIYEAIIGLAAASSPIDHVTLGNALKSNGSLEKIGGAMALANLTDSVATIANVEHYGTIVKEKAAVRKMIFAAQEVVARGFGEYGEAGDFLNDAESAIFKASQETIGEQYSHIGPLITSTFKNLEEALGKTGDITGIATGLHELDKKTAGFQRSDLIILAGRPAMGKTSLALNLATGAAKSTGLPVIIFSLEMSKDQLVRRFLSAEGRVDATKMRSGQLGADDWPRLVQAASDLSPLQIYLDDSTPMTALDIRAKCRRLSAEKGLALVVIDYLQLMNGSSRRQASREQEISEISRTLKQMAKEINVPVIALSQLNRGVESRPDKRPMMSDLRESGAIEQDADIILFVYRDEVYNEDTEKRGIAEIIIAKQRSGPTGIVDVKFTNAITRFENLAKDEPPSGFGASGGFGGGFTPPEGSNGGGSSGEGGFTPADFGNGGLGPDGGPEDY